MNAVDEELLSASAHSFWWTSFVNRLTTGGVVTFMLCCVLLVLFLFYTILLEHENPEYNTIFGRCVNYGCNLGDTQYTIFSHTIFSQSTTPHNKRSLALTGVATAYFEALQIFGIFEDGRFACSLCAQCTIWIRVLSNAFESKWGNSLECSFEANAWGDVISSRLPQGWTRIRRFETPRALELGKAAWDGRQRVSTVSSMYSMYSSLWRYFLVALVLLCISLSHNQQG